MSPVPCPTLVTDSAPRPTTPWPAAGAAAARTTAIAIKQTCVRTRTAMGETNLPREAGASQCALRRTALEEDLVDACLRVFLERLDALVDVGPAREVDP